MNRFALAYKLLALAYWIFAALIALGVYVPTQRSRDFALVATVAMILTLRSDDIQGR